MLGERKRGRFGYPFFFVDQKASGIAWELVAHVSSESIYWNKVFGILQTDALPIVIA